MKKIILVDANLLLFRSFYAALAISKNPNNMPTHLFLNSIFEIIKNEKPDFIFFAFDAHGKTKRHEIYNEYKAKRTKAPDELYIQKDLIRSILDQMNLKHFSQVGDEADDLIATLTKKFKDENEILIFSEDKDLNQLVSTNVSILQKDRNKNSNKKYYKLTIDNFYQIHNFYPWQVVDYKGIAGDTSDNLAGIKGIGPKTTIELLNKYNNLDGIYENISDLTNKQQSLFLENKNNAFLCKKLATLNSNVEIDFNLDDLKIDYEKINSNSVIELLSKNNLNKIISILKEL